MSFPTQRVRISVDDGILAGRVAGEAAWRARIAPAIAALPAATILLVSFEGVSAVTGSVLKQTWGKLHPGDQPATPAMVVDLCADVLEEFRMYLESRGIGALQALEWTDKHVRQARLHGSNEPSVEETLLALTASPGASAPELHAKGRASIGPTAWTNRLNELHRQGLVFRERDGRAWRFYPLCKEISHG